MKWGISAKINLLVGLLIVLPVVFLGWFFARHETEAMENELNLRAANMVNRFAGSNECQLGVLAQDSRGLGQLMTELKKEKDVACVRLTNESGQPLATVGAKSAEPLREFSATVKTRLQSREELSLDTGFTGDGAEEKIIGAVTMWVSLTETYHKRDQIYRLTLALVAVVLLLAISGAFFGIRHLIARPLAVLVSDIEAIGAGGDLSRRVQEKRTDEIGQLAKSFNAMTENLSKMLVSKNYVDNILDSMHDMLLVFTPDGIIRTVNRATLHILGYAENELKGQPYSLLLPEEDSLFRLSRVPDPKKTNIIHDNKDSSLISKKGTVIPVSLSATFMYGAGEGEIEGIICLAIDITERKKSEEEKRALEKRLLLAEKMEALGRLAGGVAHDLNNTLGAIVGYPDVLLAGLPAEGPHIKALNMIKQSGLKAAAIVGDLLTLARRGVKVNEVVLINTLINDYFHSPEFEQLRSHHPNVTFETYPDPQLLNIEGSPIHLSKIFVNLIANAAEAIRSNGTVTIMTQNCYLDTPQLTEDLGLDTGEYVLIKIADTGVGISLEDLKRIFDPFFSTKKMGRSGTGLGMAVVWGAIKDHNGHINVKSTPGVGALFEIYLPATRKATALPEAFPQKEDLKGEGELILVVDDQPSQREISSHLLQELDYQVATVSSGEEALVFLEYNPVRLVVLDMIMPDGMDGLDTFLEIRKRFPDLKVIISSGFSETQRVKKALKKGANAYLQKPFTLEKIAVTMHKQLKSF